MSNFDNFVQCQVIAPVAIGATALDLMPAVAPYKLPSVGGGLLVLVDSPGNPSFIEVIRYTARSGQQLTGLTRGQEGTVARAWSGTVFAFQSLMAGDFQSLLDSKLNAATYTAADVLTKIKTVDGVGSGLDADLLDGQSGAYYQSASNLNAGTLPDARLSGTYTGVSITGNAATATKLTTARTIGGVSFDGTASINLPGVNAAGNQSTTGNAATATKLATARTLGGVSFDGTANITLPGVNAVGNQSTTGNAATATALQTARTIGGVAFDGTANINLPGVNAEGNQNTSGNAATATKLATSRTVNGVAFDGTANITVADPTKVPLAGGNLTGDLIYQNVGVGGWARGLTAKIQSTAAYAAGIGFYGSGDSVTTVYLGLGAGPWSSGNGVRVTAAGVTISGATAFDTLITGSVNGNAATATTLTGLTPTIAELNYVDGVTSSIQTQLNAKAPLASPALTGTPTVPTATAGTNTTQIASTAYTVAEIGSRAPTKTGGGASGSWGISVTGSSASCSGLAASATTLTGLTATVTELNYTDGVTSAIQTQLDGKAPLTGVGASGTWPVAITGNAATATKLATARTINGVAFDGTANISIAAGETGRLPLTGGAVTGKTSFTKIEQTTYDTAAVEIGAQSGAAYIGFHRHGVFGGLFGVDTGNNFYGNAGLTMTGNITAYSDIRLKTDIEVISDALNKVCTLRGVTYTRIEGNERQTGVIAQEVQAVLPEAVKIGEDVDQTLSVAYGNLVGLLIEAIKELKAEVDVLKQGAK